MAVFTVDTAADIASQNGAANWWEALLDGNLGTSSSSGGNPTTSGSVPTSLQGLFGVNAPTGPSLPSGTVSPLSDLFKDIPTGLANNDVTHTPNNNITVGGSPYMLRPGQTFAPKPGYSIIHGLHQGAYGYYEIPTADIANSAQKYGIFNLGQGPLTQGQMAQMNDPSGYQAGKYSAANNWGFNPTGGWAGSATGGGTGGGGGGSVVTDPPPGGGGGGETPPPGPQLPELSADRKKYLDAIDAFIRSRPENQYASSITDEMRRAFNLPGMAELQMNQAANPIFNAANFTNVSDPKSVPFIPGATPPKGFKWSFMDPDGSSGLTPGNYGLTPNSDFFDVMPGTQEEDLQQMLKIFNDPAYANKYLPSSANLAQTLGLWGSFINPSGGQNGQRASLAPQESINLLSPLLGDSQVSNYLGQLMTAVKGRLGSQYNNFNPFQWSNLTNPNQISGYLRGINNQLDLTGLPSLDAVLNSYKAGSSLDRDQFFNGNSLDFYQPSEKAPAFFQYLLGDFDGSGPAPETYGLRMRGAPQTKYDAEQVLQTLNNPLYKNMFSTQSNINPNIFTQTLNMEGNPIFKILDAYKFPLGAGGPAGGSQNTNLGTGQQQQTLSMERWVPGANEQTGAQEAARRQAENSKWQSLYGGGFGTGDLNSPTTPPPGGTTPPGGSTPTPTGTTPPNPYAGISAPYNAGSDRPPPFKTSWNLYT